MKKTSLVLLICLLLGKLILVSCYAPDKSFSSPSYTGPVNSCSGQGECAESDVCDVELGICVHGGAAKVATYYLVVTPLSTADIPAQAFSKSLPSEESNVFAVHQPVDVPLKLQATDPDGSPAILDIDYRLEITRIESGMANFRLAGVSPVVNVYTIGADSADEFSVKLLPGTNSERTYNMKISVVSSTFRRYPPVYYDQVTVTAKGKLVHEGKTLEKLVVRQSDPTSDREILNGTVTRGVGVFEKALEGMAVIARDPLTGRVVSSESITDANGEFEIGLPLGVQDFRLIAFKPNTQWYPTIEMDVAVKDSFDDVSIVGVRLDAPVLYTARFQSDLLWTESKVSPGMDLKGIGDPYGVSNCIVILEYNDGTGVSHAVRNAITDVAGMVNEFLYPAVSPAAYVLTVIPPVAGNFEEYALDVLYDEFEIREDSKSVESHLLRKRSRIRGGILTKDSQISVPGGVIRAYPLIGTPRYARVSQATVIADGTFEIYTDSGGDFQFVVEAPAQSRYAWASFTKPSVDDENVLLELPVPFATPIELRLAESAAPSKPTESPKILAGAAVEVFLDVEDNLIRIGHLKTDGEGTGVILLEPLVIDDP